MRKIDDEVTWGRLGRTEKLLLILLAAWAMLYVTGVLPGLFFPLTLLTGTVGIVWLVKIARMAMRRLIWRLSNRLIVAYLFVAVVPVVLLLALLLVTSHIVIGQMAVYLVKKELDNRVAALAVSPQALIYMRLGDSQTALNSTITILQRSFPTFEMFATGERAFRYPPGSTISPPADVLKNSSGIVLLKDRDSERPRERLFAWAHAKRDWEEVTILAPITPELLADLVPGIGYVSFIGKVNRSQSSRVPPPANPLDFECHAPYPVSVPSWDDPSAPTQRLLLVVDTRYSAVLGIVFGQKAEWSDLVMEMVFILVAVLFTVELVSLWAGIKVTRTVTGAVHELYEGTQHIREGDFSYRIPVEGTDQLAELSTSFNTMTANLGRLIVVAKEKERLESELSIARDVQNQLFPNDLPSTGSLELTGVCNPARTVSGDYYDFMRLNDRGLAFAIGDVAGKGISAALLMATIQSTMRTLVSAAQDPTECTLSTAVMVATLNRQLYATTSPEKYATFFVALYDDATHLLTYTNAGHLAPLLLRGGEIQMLDSTGTVVGAFPSAPYDERCIALESGDLLLAYTDGIVEPENAYGEMFGEERLKDLVSKYAKADASELIARTMQAVVQWTGEGELQDDMTMIVARRL